MRRADAVDVGRAIRDAEVAGIHHPQVNVQRLPKLPGAPGAGLRACLAASIGPPLPDAVAALDVLAAIFVEAAHIRLEPRVEDGDADHLQKVAHAVAPAGLLFRRTRQHEIHRPGQIHSGSLHQTVLVVGATHGGHMLRGAVRYLKRQNSPRMFSSPVPSTA